MGDHSGEMKGVGDGFGREWLGYRDGVREGVDFMYYAGGL